MPVMRLRTKQTRRKIQVSTRMNSTFHHRCSSALTHPVTMAALVTLLINDLALKAFWQNPWTTGKLSDLAWVIFASPLLAFILSLLVRRSRPAQRVVFAISYIGLPLLYAAYNSFQPLHDIIMRGLLMLSGAATGSPFDPTDSLVIPLGLGVALWVWTRPTAPPASLRIRLALLMASAASFATIATPAPHTSDTLVGQWDEETLVLSRDHYVYVSRDGGLTWQEELTYLDTSTLDTSTVEWGESDVQTPGGRFSIDGLEIKRSHGGVTETVYSPSYLRVEGDVRFQKYLQMRSFPYSGPSPGIRNLVYDERSGNIVAATRSQGVVVGAVDGDWKQVSVGRLKPTDFSFSNKLNALMDEGTFWMAAVALAMWGTALGLWLWHADKEPPKSRQIRRYTGPRPVNSPGETNTGAFIGIGCLAISAIALIIGLSNLLTSRPPYGVGSDLNDPVATVTLIAGGLLALAVCLGFRPLLRQLPTVLIAFLVMNALFVLAFAIGVLQGFNLSAAKFYSVILVLAASFTLYLCLHQSREPASSDD